MKALVVYESMWGNTRKVAEAVGRGLGGTQVAAVAEVSQVSADSLDDLDLLVVGGPTHAFSMSRPSTRHDAHGQGASEGPEDRGIREWIEALPDRLDVPVALFDTRATVARHLPGSAAKAASKELRRHHRARVVGRDSFFVLDSSGPLADGELQRAQDWGAQLTADLEGS